MRLSGQKKAIRSFMQDHYSDERLAMLLAHARDGKLAFLSCCCFVGIPTAEHTLRGRRIPNDSPHLVEAKRLAGAEEAETAYYEIAGRSGFDATRLRILIPMIRAEVKRRENLRAMMDSVKVSSEQTESQAGPYPTALSR